MELYVPGTIFDESIMPLLQLDLCVPYGEAFSRTVNTNIQGQVAVFDAAACPESLDVDDASFNALYKDKIAIWVRSAPESCMKDFWEWGLWYKRLMNAGAKAVVSVGIPGRTPGVWYTTFSKERMAEELEELGLDNIPNADLIPMVACGLTSTKNKVATATMSTLETFKNFMDARSLDLTTRAALTTAAATLGPANFTEEDFNYLSNSVNLTADIQVSESLWGNMMAAGWYKFLFHGVVATLFFIAVALGVRFAYERVSLSRSNGVSWSKLINIPLAALAIEIATSFVCGIFYAIDGMWDTFNSPVAEMRNLMLFSLTITSMGSSVLVGLSFSDFRQSSKMLRIHKSTFVQNHRVGLVVGGVGLIALEIVSTALRRYSEAVYIVTNTVAVGLGVLIAIWFGFEAWYFSKMLHEIASNNTTIGDSGTDRLRQVLRHTRLWASISSASLLAVLIIGFVTNTQTQLFWNVNGWPVLMGMSLVSRGIYAISKVILCRLPQTQRSTKRKASYMDTNDNTFEGTTDKAQLDFYSNALTMPSYADL